MDKRKLGKIPLDPVPDHEKLPRNHFLITCRKIKNEPESMICFYREARDLEFRLFVDKGDYITQEIQIQSRKWRTGRIGYLMNWYWSPTVQFVFQSDKDRDLFNQLFPYHGETNAVWQIEHWQNEILDKRRKDRYQRELEELRERQEGIPALPDNFTQWMFDEVLKDQQYIVYEPIGNRKTTKGFCTHCQEELTIYRRDDPKRNRVGICSKCGKSIIYQPQSAQLNRYNEKWAGILQRQTDGVVLRVFKCGVRFARDSKSRLSIYRGVYFWNREIFRQRYLNDGSEERYFFSEYKLSEEMAWQPGAYCHADMRLYLDNYSFAVDGTVLEYSALDVFQKAVDKPINVCGYIRKYQESPVYEYLIKFGLSNLVYQITSSQWSAYLGFNHNSLCTGSTPQEILGMDMQNIRTLRDANGGTEDLALLRQFDSDGIHPTVQDLTAFRNLHAYRKDELLGVVNAHRIPIQRFVRYIQKQNYKTAECCQDWLDYIRWAALLHYDLEDEYYLLPTNLHEAHDRALEQHNARRDKIAQEKMRAIEKKVKKICKQMKNVQAMSMNIDGLMIVTPKTADDIRNEGNILHHCVGTYIDSVASGKTSILFVRKTEEPDMPYFTLEYRDHSIQQCRGMRNCSPPPEVEAFVKAFEQKIQAETMEVGA